MQQTLAIKSQAEATLEDQPFVVCDGFKMFDRMQVRHLVKSVSQNSTRVQGGGLLERTGAYIEQCIGRLACRGSGKGGRDHGTDTYKRGAVDGNCFAISGIFASKSPGMFLQVSTADLSAVRTMG